MNVQKPKTNQSYYDSKLRRRIKEKRMKELEELAVIEKSLLKILKEKQEKKDENR